MAYDGSLKFDTSMNAEGFQQGADKLTGVASKAFAAVGAAAAAALAVIGKVGVGYNAQMEEYTTNFTTMLGSQEAAIKKVEAIKEMAAKTPFGMEDLASGTQTLLAFGIESDRTMDILRQIGDVSLGNKDKFSALTLAFAQMSSAGRLMGQDLLQMVNAGFNPLQVISEQTGESMADLKKKMEEGAISAEMVAEAFAIATSEGGKFYNGMEAASKTLTGQWSTLKDDAAAAAGAMFQPFNDVLSSQVLPNIIALVGDLTTNLSSSQMQGAMTKIAQGFGDLIETGAKIVTAVLPPLISAIATLTSSFEAWGPVVIGVAAAFKAYSVVGTVTAAFKAMQTAVGASSSILAKATLTAGKDAAMRTTLAAALASETTAELVKTAAKKAGMTVDAAGNLITAQGTAATAAETAAVLASSGALSAKAVIAGVLTGQISLATAAQWLWNVAMSANPIGLIIAGVVALTAAIIGLVAWLSTSSEEYKKQKEEVEALTTAQEELTAATEESADAYESTAAEIAANGKVAKDLVGTLKEVSSSTANADEKNRKMSATVDQLNAAVDGLNIAYDEETGAIRNINTGQEISLAQLEELVSAKAELAQANAWQERANELVKEQVQIQEELAVIEAKKQEIMANSNLTAREQEKLIEELDEAAEGHATTMADVEMRLGVVNENIAASNTATAESVVADYERMEQAITENGESIDAVAARWGVSVESIKAAWADAGGSFDEFVTAQDEGMAEYAESVAAHTDEVINSFKEIPAEYEMSAQEMIDTLRTNRERYAEWKQAMVEISGQVSAETLAELEKLGPGALSAINEMRENGGEGLRAFDEEIRATLDDSTGYASQVYNDPAFTGAPAAAFDAAAALVNENTALPVAVTQQMEGARAAAEAVDFSEVGQNIAADIVDGLNSADVTGAMQDITAAISNNTGRVTSAVTSMSTAVQTALRNMKTQAVNIATQMMTEINSAVVSRTATVRSSATALANGVVSSLRAMVSGAEGVAEDMMDGIGYAMDRKAPSLYSKARQIAANIAAIMADALDVNSPSRVMIRLFEYVMLGIYKGMDGMSGMLYREAESIAGGITERLTISPDIADALVERMRAVTDSTPLGGSTLVPQAAYAGAGGATRYVTSLTQNITTPKPLSPSEMTREGQDLLRRSRWQLP